MDSPCSVPTVHAAAPAAHAVGAEERNPSALRRLATYAALLLVALEPGCARFGYEDLPRRGEGLGGSLVNTDGDPPRDAGAPHPGVDASTPDGVAAPPDAGSPPDASPDGPELPDARPDPPPTDPPLCTLSPPELLGEPNYADNSLWSPSLSADALSLYFAVRVPGWVEEIGVATRAAPGAAFGLGQSLAAPVNTGTEGTPSISADGLSLYFFSERSGGAGGRDLYVATRASTSDAFATVRALTGLNTADREHLPRLSADELTLHFVSNRSGNTEIWRATRASRSAEFANPELVPELNSDGEDGAVTLSPDGLEAILSSDRTGTQGARDLFRATRTSSAEPFSAAVPLTEINSDENDYDPTLSFDGTELYFVSNRSGSAPQIYRSLRSCP